MSFQILYLHFHAEFILQKFFLILPFFFLFFRPPFPFSFSVFFSISFQIYQRIDNFLAEKEHFKEIVRKERDEEIQDIHKRVQNAIEKKDESLEVIIKENASLKDRCIKLEAIVRQQRKDYCIK